MLIVLNDSPKSVFSLSVYFMDWMPQFDITKSFNITAQGTGVAMLSVSVHEHAREIFIRKLFVLKAFVLSSQVFSLYYALPEEKDDDCNVFDLSVTMDKQDEGSIDRENVTWLIWTAVL